MNCTQALSGAERRRRGAGSFAALAALLTLAACATPNIEPIAFRCDPRAACTETNRAGCCPEGYSCNSSVCVRMGERVPVLLSRDLAAHGANFSLLPRPDGVRLCWMQSSESNTRGLYRSDFTAAGGASQPVGVYTAPMDDLTNLTTFFATCGSIGDRDYALVLRRGVPPLNTVRFLADDGSSRRLSESIFRVIDLSPFTSAVVGNELWFPLIGQPAEATGRIGRPLSIVSFNPTTAGSAMGGATVRTLPITPYSSNNYGRSSELYVGATGLWYAVPFQSGGMVLARLVPSDLDRTLAFAPWPEPMDRSQFVPLAVNGDELAVAAQAPESREWRIFWIEPGPDSPMPGSMVRVFEGPRITMDPQVERPAGIVRGGNLIVAGSMASGAALSFWSVPWRGTSAMRSSVSLRKLSTTPAQRLTLRESGGRVFVAWAEQVRPFTAGETDYSALFVSATDL